MRIERYDVTISTDQSEYRFVSEGRHGRILKKVRFTPIRSSGIYNLGFGDVDPETGLVSDVRISDNGDTQKVLATVASIALDFLKRNPKATLYAEGSTPSRTRLYRMGLTRHLDEISQVLHVAGRTDEGWEVFQSGKKYNAFLAKPK